MKVTAKADYAVRAVLELATVDDGLVKGEQISRAQGIPLKFLENILIDLRHAGIVHAQRGAEGGYRLARGAGDVTLGEGDSTWVQTTRSRAEELELSEGQIVWLRTETEAEPVSA